MRPTLVVQRLMSTTLHLLEWLIIFYACADLYILMFIWQDNKDQHLHYNIYTGELSTHKVYNRSGYMTHAELVSFKVVELAFNKAGL